LTAAFHGDPQSIRTLAERLSAKLNRNISPRQLRAFCAQSKTTARFPLLLLPPLLEVLEDDRGLRNFALGDREKIFNLGEAAAAILSEAAQRKLLAKTRREK